MTIMKEIIITIKAVIGNDGDRDGGDDDDNNGDQGGN